MTVRERLADTAWAGLYHLIARVVGLGTGVRLVRRWQDGRERPAMLRAGSA